ncbi:cyclin-O [Anoplopoma fimbria]|uniref:cyclin-O n=1 Tax=Anoplopoma fimbria TaxID=229290 RepID=UPI0023EB5C83|nr:cyclin-O [Anoplopoma fimbria]
MVSFVNGERGSEAVYKRRRTAGASPPTEAHATDRQPQTGRHRKQTLVSKLSDSGFEEDLGLSPVCSLARVDASPLRSHQPPAGQLSSWYLQYGDVGFQIQRDKEAQFHSCKSLARQPQLTAEARCKLVSWLIPVHKHFHLSFECCCLAVNIMDRFMASTPVAADCFQLLGVTALLLASKQVEVSSPRIGHLLALCCDSFTKEQLCNLECLVLLRLNFHLAAPTLAFFLDFYANCVYAEQLEAECAGGGGGGGGGGFARTNADAKRSGRRGNLARKVCELSLADYAFNRYPPSLTARCALRIAGESLEGEPEDQWGGFVGEPCTQPSWSPEICDVEAKGHILSLLSQGSRDHTLAQECRDNLRLLVSLNQESLEVMSAV